MNLDRAIGILNYSRNAGFAEARMIFQEKTENIQFLADTADNEGIRELYLVQISNLKRAWQLLQEQKQDLEEKAIAWEKKKEALLSSGQPTELQKEAEEALQCAQVEWSRQLFAKVGELQPRNNQAFEQVVLCNHILSEYKKAERERERLRQIEESNASRGALSDREQQEQDWIEQKLLKHGDDTDGPLSPWIKGLFLSGSGAVHVSAGKKSLRKDKKEAMIFSSIVLVFALVVLGYTYSDNIGGYLDTLQYEKASDGSVVYSTEDYIKKADDLYEGGNYVKALIQYSLASAMDPENDYIQEQIAVCKLLIRQEQNAYPTNFVNSETPNNQDSVEVEATEIAAGEIEENLEEGMQEDLLAEEQENTEYSAISDTIPDFTEEEEQNSEEENQAKFESSLLDTLVSTDALDSVLLTDDSTFVANIEVEDVPEVDSVKKINPKIALGNQELKERIIKKANNRLKEDKEFLSKVYLVADKRPEPRGGYENFDEYLRRNMEYPRRAAKNKIEGVVYVQFVVNRDGTISNATTTTNLGYGLEEEAIRLISEYPGWEPGKINSRRVNVQTSLPIWFVNQ